MGNSVKTNKNKTKSTVTKTGTSLKKNNGKSNKKAAKSTKVKDFFSSVKFLKIVFVLLCILVAILSILVAKKSKEEDKHPSANIVIPISADSDEFAFNISASGLAETSEYVFKVTNSVDGEINKDEVGYKILIENENDCVISLNKDGDSTNLIANQVSTTIDNQKLDKNKLDEDYYHVKIVSKGKLGARDLIRVKVYR